MWAMTKIKRLCMEVAPYSYFINCFSFVKECVEIRALKVETHTCQFYCFHDMNMKCENIKLLKVKIKFVSERFSTLIVINECT